MTDKKALWLATGVVCGAMLMAEGADSIEKTPNDKTGHAEIMENIGRRELFSRSTGMVRQANALMDSGKYREAIAEYRKVVALLKPAAGGEFFKNKVDFCIKQIGECYYLMAEAAMEKADDLATSMDFEEAIKIIEEAKQFCPERKDELEDRIKFYQKRREAAITRESVDMSKLDPNYAAQEYQIELLIEQGIVLLKRDELMKARRKFEQVLLIDPYNNAAMQNLLGINKRLQKAAAGRASATSRHLIGQAEWSGAIPVVAEAPAGTGENQIGIPVDKKVENELEKRLRAIKIPNYVLYDNMQTFAEAMDDLRAQANESRKPNERVINFVIRDVKHDDPAKAPKLAGYSPGETFLYDILAALKERGDLDFKLDDNAVIIVAKGLQLEKMNVQIFSFAPNPDETEASLMENLKAGAKVTFAPGSYFRLVSASNEVISCNTPENQKRIENWLANHSDTGLPMVQVMFKFLEVSQNDLDELGFNWQYARQGRKLSFTAGGNALLRHYNNDDADDRMGGTSVNGGMGKVTDAFGGNQVMEDPDATLNLLMGDRKNALMATVYALDWADSSDILYSPRVTTLSGTTATVNMGEKHHYPGEYEDTDNENTERARVTVIQPQPTLDDEQTLGITFSIRPEADVESQMISAKVHFDIKQFDSWLTVDSRNLNSDDDDGEFQKKAVINTRYIDTKVQLKDGETVLIGSISNDMSTIMHDKLPILGDIPFIGRFFQSKYTVSKKNNLLVFMTCRMIKPDGSALFVRENGEPMNMGGMKGLPVFPKNQ
ncbi:MAG: hypothetical protein E7057_04170 [Lentisphaerae bacterium]|nr:hypothetical protein [Lentisphaerota bacterium]